MLKKKKKKKNEQKEERIKLFYFKSRQFTLFRVFIWTCITIRGILIFEFISTYQYYLL